MAKKKAKRAKTQENPMNYNRRRFLNQALAASAGVAISRLMPHLYALPLPPGCSPSPLAANELLNPGEITSVGTTLRSVLVVHDESRTVPTLTGQSFMLRAYEGYAGNRIDPTKRVTKTGIYYPGPTFRAKVGDTIQIALLNHINPQNFPETPNGQCDVTTTPTGGQIYPSPSPPAPGTDVKPDCFRGSNHTNMHFHGTHVSPNAFSDNVLVEIAPDLNSTTEECDRLFESVACKDYPTPQSWQHQDAGTEKTLREFFAGNQQRLKALPPEDKDKELHTRQAEHNDMLIEYGQFPQYWSGCFPYCIRPPKSAPPFTMAQAQGTHWYHAHKHGSTSIQIFNGMAGALILEGDDYDTPLKNVMPGIEQKVLLIQEFAQQPNMERVGAPSIKNPPGIGVVPGGARVTPLLLINGQANPTITMQAGEVQWWRIINATVHRGKGGYVCTFTKNNPTAKINFRQIAQDGVQFHQDNYASQIPPPGGTGRLPVNFLLGPANRVDILVQAPSTPGTAILAGFNTGTNFATDPILTVNVVKATGTCNTTWPTASQFPKQPAFLGDITSFSERRYLKYQMTNRGGIPTINDKTFQEGRVDESMLLGTKQEWILENYSTSADGSPLHPFHIHINPFQILEVFDPTNSLKDVLSFSSAAFGNWGKIKIAPNGAFLLPAPWVWWDTFPLPLAASATKPGYIRFRTWFTDFAGKFVDHCHILAHEDRGMMQLIEVVDNKTPYQHR
jgi:FtsP/CotA-like multicopper oxidase with cupredoxin domain